VPLLVEPVTEALARQLRAAVLAHCTHERRRVFAPVLHVGRPGSERVCGIRVDESLDHALRCDVVAALVRGLDRSPEPPLVWVTRPGGHVLHDVDAAWLAAARAAYAEAGLPLTLVVVTREGWWDPRSGTGRRWKRLRQR